MKKLDVGSSMVLIFMGVGILVVRFWFPTLVAAERVKDLPMAAVVAIVGGLFLLWQSVDENRKNRKGE